MAIDIESEELVSIREAADSPKLQTRPHFSSIWRWVYHGVRGIKLETVSIGGRRLTSQEAIARFIERTTEAAQSPSLPPPPPRSPKRRQRAHEAAERELAAAGV